MNSPPLNDIFPFKCLETTGVMIIFENGNS